MGLRRRRYRGWRVLPDLLRRLRPAPGQGSPAAARQRQPGDRPLRPRQHRLQLHRRRHEHHHARRPGERHAGLQRPGRPRAHQRLRRHPEHLAAPGISGRAGPALHRQRATHLVDRWRAAHQPGPPAAVQHHAGAHHRREDRLAGPRHLLRRPGSAARYLGSGHHRGQAGRDHLRQEHRLQADRWPRGLVYRWRQPAGASAGFDLHRHLPVHLYCRADRSR
ncbi:hypothetical protein D3C81_1206280 [compost metagenome]